MNSSELDYTLPPERIARFPSEKRDGSRLLVYDRASDTIEHAHFADLPKFLKTNFNFFRNNAAVLKGRIFAKKEHGRKRRMPAAHPVRLAEPLDMHA